MNIWKIATLAATAVVLAALATGAQARPETFRWVMPTQDTEGNPIPATGPDSLQSTTLQHGTCAGTQFGMAVGEVTIPAPVTQATVDLPVGTHCARARVRTQAGELSGWSNVAVRVVQPATPLPPTLLVDNPVAYEVLPNPDGSTRLGRMVGLAAVGSVCEPADGITAAGYHWVRGPLKRQLFRPVDGALGVAARCS